MTTLEQQLGALGNELASEATDPDALVVAVLARLAEDARQRRYPLVPRVAAAVVVVLAVVATAVPSSRRTVAGWFGFEGARVERRPDLDVPATAPAVPSAGDPSLAPGDRVVEVGGARILVSELDGTLVLEKVLPIAGGVVPVDVGGRPGLWISGAPHEVVIRTADGAVTTRRFAGDTLLWQDGRVIRRVEGFTTLDDALAFARGT